MLIYLIFSSFCHPGYPCKGLDIDDAIANTRAVGAVAGRSLLGGPLVGFLVGLTGGLHRFIPGGSPITACAISTTCEGLLGLVHWRLMRAGKMDALFEPRITFFTTLYAGSCR